jgi:TonB family protein
LLERLDFVLEEKPRRGVSVAITVSLILHAVFILYIVKTYRPISSDQMVTPMVRYVELIRKNPQFVEAPGPKVNSAPLTAPYSDANRRASMPHPNGEKPTRRPGEGGFYTPSTAAQKSASSGGAPPTPPPVSPSLVSSQTPVANDTFAYHPVQANVAKGQVDWHNAIREVGKIASIGTGQQSLDLGNPGGEKGFAESGPLSFETQWYDWGEYAESMVSRIRVNWYNNMPQLLQTGLKGVVTIRFTIQRDGRLTDMTTLSSSTVPPYDFAARKAIELSSPLNPLPKDFPNATERVTCMFFYNQEPPAR